MVSCHIPPFFYSAAPTSPTPIEEKKRSKSTSSERLESSHHITSVRGDHSHAKKHHNQETRGYSGKFACFFFNVDHQSVNYKAIAR